MRLRALKVVLAASVLLGLGVGLRAQDPATTQAAVAQSGDPAAAPDGAGQMNADAVRKMQRELAAIDADRAKWVGEFLDSWQDVLDPQLYDVRKELTSAAMRAPAWQLYSASLVSDLSLMSKILKGRTGGGQYVNSIRTPQAKIGPQSAVDNLLGQTTTDLTFTPIAPCRVVDTRPGPGGPGARTGLIPANATRLFDLEDDAITAGQGGGPFPCPGLPTDSPAAWSVNVTIVGPFAAFGGLKMYGAASAEPNASIINWSPGTGATANSLVVNGCHLCGDDVIIKTFGEASHVIIDVMGYFDNATAADATITRSAVGSSTGVAGQLIGVTSGACPAGTQLVGGETDVTSTNMHLAEFRQSGSAWFATLENTSGVSQTVDLYARCLDTPVRLQ